MSSNETAAYEIMKSLDVDYVLIIFGGVIGYSGDDINKFLWMVRIAEGEHPKDIRVSRNNFFEGKMQRFVSHDVWYQLTIICLASRVKLSQVFLIPFGFWITSTVTRIIWYPDVFIVEELVYYRRKGHYSNHTRDHFYIYSKAGEPQNGKSSL